MDAVSCLGASMIKCDGDIVGRWAGEPLKKNKESQSSLILLAICCTALVELTTASKEQKSS